MSDKLTTLEIVRGRLANGRTIADSDVHKLVAEIDRLRAALRQLLTVMPVFPDAAKKIVGMEDRYNAALDAARAALKEAGHE